MLLDLIKNIHWRKLRFIIVLFCVSSIFFGICYERFNSSKAMHQDVLSQLDSQKNINYIAEQQLSLFKKINPYYQYLINDGVIGKSHRLQWLETLQESSLTLGIPKINFILENARKANQANDYYWDEQIVFEKTLLSIDFELLHEGDFYNFLNRFSSDVKGLFSIERCDLKRVELAREDDFGGLQGLCELEAYTFFNVRNEDIKNLYQEDKDSTHFDFDIRLTKSGVY